MKGALGVKGSARPGVVVGRKAKSGDLRLRLGGGGKGTTDLRNSLSRTGGASGAGRASQVPKPSPVDTTSTYRLCMALGFRLDDSTMPSLAGQHI
jgi:hypothetical protein